MCLFLPGVATWRTRRNIRVVWRVRSAAFARRRLLHVVDDERRERGCRLRLRRGSELCPADQDSVQPRSQRPATVRHRH